MTIYEFMKNYDISLNRQQLKAVQTGDGPFLLLAVPGSGKTTVLIVRLGYLIFCRGIMPEQILVLTYTVAAARDMAQRFQSYFGAQIRKRLEFRTINGICARVIHFYGRLIGKDSYRLVTEEKFSAALIADAYQKIEGSYPSENDIKGVRTLITYIKNMMLSGEEILELDKESGINISKIYRAYCDGMRQKGLMDYDDQMVYAMKILRRSPETLAYFQNRYQYLCVDEAQDTSRIQHMLIALIAGSKKNLFMVGDEDQSIYGFRAAYPQALLSFEKDYPGAGVLLMEENYRSNARIVEAADRFIQKNILRHEKHMRAFRQAGADIREIELKSRKAQYTYLSKVAADCHTRTAVLYRDNESVLPLVDLLERKGIPYAMRNADLTFFSHRVVMDIQNIIRFAMNPWDTELFSKIYYKLNLFINKQEAAEFMHIAEREKLPVLEAALKSGQAAGRIQNNLSALREQLGILLKEPADKAVYRIEKLMGYGNYLERVQVNDGKLYILKCIAANEESPGRFLERMQELQEIVKERENNSTCPFILSTIHASKGLEYDTVYLLDTADGIFPEKIPSKPRSGSHRQGKMKSADEKEWEYYEEERRLFYVGVTRAQNNLNLFLLPSDSTFCRELTGKTKKGRTYSAQSRSGYSNTLTAGKTDRKHCKEAYETFCDSLGEGVCVRHNKYGEGSVVERSGDYVTVQFQCGQKKLSLWTIFQNDLLTTQV